MRPLFVLSAFDYGFLNQRPQALTEELHQTGTPIVYIDPQRMGAGRTRRRFQTEEIEAGFWHVHPAVGTDAAANKQKLGRFISRFAKEQGFSEYNLWLSSPYDEPVLDHCAPERVLFESLDNPIHDRGRYNRLRRRLIGRVDTVIRSSPSLLPGVPAFDSPQGVSLDRFRPRPVFGFCGLVGPWTDVKLLTDLARAYPDSEVVIVGPWSPGVAEKAPPPPDNLRRLGEVPYRDVPFYLKAFDVCLVPNRPPRGKMKDHLQGRHPLKVYEYLAMGKPVVAMRLPALEGAAAVIHLCDTKDEFINRCAQAFRRDSRRAAAKRQQFAARHSWRQRASELTRHLEDHGF